LQSYNDITFLSTKKKSGAQTARNIGIKAAKSDWIAFLDSDDEWLEDKLEKQVLALNSVNNNPMTVVHGDCIVNNIESQREYNWHLDPIDGENVHSQLLVKSGTLFPAILTSRKALERIEYLDENIISYQEWDTAIRLSKFCMFIHLQKPLFYYNIHDSSISRSSLNNINGYHHIVQKFREEIIRNCSIHSYHEHIKKCAVMAMNSKRYKLGRSFLSNIPNSTNKSFLLLLSYFRIKPKYLYQSLKYLSWKN